MFKFLVPAFSVAILSLAAVAPASAGVWGAYYPQKAHDSDGSQAPNARSGTSSGPSASGSSSSKATASKQYSGGTTTTRPGNTNGGGVSHSAPGPELGLGLPALAMAGCYLLMRRRAKK